MGFSWKFLDDDMFKDVKFILDNLMKVCVSQGLEVSVKKAQTLMPFDEDYLWNIGLLGTHNPEVLLNTMVFNL